MTVAIRSVSTLPSGSFVRCAHVAAITNNLAVRVHNQQVFRVLPCNGCKGTCSLSVEGGDPYRRHDILCSTPNQSFQRDCAGVAYTVAGGCASGSFRNQSVTHSLLYPGKTVTPSTCTVAVTAANAAVSCAPLQHANPIHHRMMISRPFWRTSRKVLGPGARSRPAAQAVP